MGVVPQKQARVVFLRHGGGRAEVAYVEGADADDLWKTRSSRGFETIRSCAVNSPDELVDQFRGADVEDANKGLVTRKGFEGLPSRASGMDPGLMPPTSA